MRSEYPLFFHFFCFFFYLRKVFGGVESKKKGEKWRRREIEGGEERLRMGVGVELRKEEERDWW